MFKRRFLGVAIVAYAITNLFFTKSQSSEFSKKTIFQFNLITGLNRSEVGLGDSFSVSPVIFNDSSEDMYAFIEIKKPEVGDSPLYIYQVDSEWCVVSADEGTAVYAYGNSEMTVLTPGESTSALTSQMNMRLITNAQYA